MSKETTTQGLSNSVYLCPNCQTNNLLNEITVTEIQKFWVIETSRKVVEHYILCSACGHRVSRKNELDKIKPKVEKNKDGLQVREKIEAIHLNDKIVNQKRTVYDFSNYFPNVENKKLYFTTLNNLLLFINRKQENLTIENHELYQRVQEELQIHGSTGVFENEEDIKLLFSICVSDFDSIAVNFLLKNAVSPLKGQWFVHPEIMELFFALFGIQGSGDLNLDQRFADLFN